jgi:hypothetical protein
MKSKRFISFIAMMLLACNNTSSVFSITNKSSHTIDSIIVTSNGLVSVYKNLLPNIAVTKQLVFNPKTDGAFGILIYKGDSLISGGMFGYYTNGRVESVYAIEIKHDYKIREA